MTQLNTYSDITSFVNTIFEDALFVARESNVMENLVTRFAGEGMAARKVQEYNAGTAQSIGESDDLTSGAFTPTALSTLTPGEIGLQFFLTDQRIETDPFGVRTDAAQELGLAIADKVEADILGLFNDVTGGTIGTSGGTITWGYFFAALTALKAQKAPPPYVCVLHPYTYHQLAKAASIAASTQPAPVYPVDDTMRRWWVANVGGVDIFTTSNISIDTSDDAYGCMFSRSALAIDWRRPPRLEPERDASRRGWELNMTAVYAYGTWRPKFGVQMLFDATAPTS